MGRMMLVRKKKDRDYLRPGRLADLLALIQVLALSPLTRRTEPGLKKELRRDPISAPSWIELGLQHSEFFRIHTPKDKPTHIALIARNVQEDGDAEDGADAKKPILPPDTTIKLMEIVTDLHDRQLASSQAWRNWALPMLVSGLALAGSMGSAYLTTFWKQNPVTNINVYTSDAPSASRAQAAPPPAAQK